MDFKTLTEYPFLIILCIDFLIMAFLYTNRSSKGLDLIAEHVVALEHQSQEIQEQLINLKELKDVSKNLYNLHSARHARNTMRKIYINKPRKPENVRGNEAAHYAYKKAKDEFTEFALTLC